MLDSGHGSQQVRGSRFTYHFGFWFLEMFSLFLTPVVFYWFSLQIICHCVCVCMCVWSRGNVMNHDLSAPSFSFFKCLFIYLAVPGPSCSTWDPVPWPDIERGPPVLGAWSPSPWTSWEVPRPCRPDHALRLADAQLKHSVNGLRNPCRTRWCLNHTWTSLYLCGGFGCKRWALEPFLPAAAQLEDVQEAVMANSWPQPQQGLLQGCSELGWLPPVLASAPDLTLLCSEC